MIRSLFALLCVAWLTQGGYAQNSIAGLFEERTHDFGIVPRGAKRVHTFTLTNTSKQTLRILSIRIPCNCLAATATKKELGPGETTTIVAELDTRRFGGALTKVCFILFDQPREEVQLSVKAFSHDGVAMAPDSLAFGKVKKGTSPEKSVKLSIADPRLGNAFQAAAESVFVQTSVEVLAENSGNASFRVTARLRPDLPSGDWYCIITLQHQDTNQGPIQIPLTVTVGP